MKNILLACLLLSLTGCAAFRELARQDREWRERHKNDPDEVRHPRCYYNMGSGQYELYPMDASSMPVY